MLCSRALTTRGNGSWSLRTRNAGRIPSWAGHQGSQREGGREGNTARRRGYKLRFVPPCSADVLSNTTLSFNTKEEAVAFAVKSGKPFSFTASNPRLLSLSSHGVLYSLTPYPHILSLLLFSQVGNMTLWNHRDLSPEQNLTEPTSLGTRKREYQQSSDYKWVAIESHVMCM